MMPTSAWKSATQPHFVSGPNGQPVAPAVKQREAEDLAAAVRSHIAAGGRYEVLASGSTPTPAHRVLGELLGEA